MLHHSIDIDEPGSRCSEAGYQDISLIALPPALWHGGHFINRVLWLALIPYRAGGASISIMRQRGKAPRISISDAVFWWSCSPLSIVGDQRERAGSWTPSSLSWPSSSRTETAVLTERTQPKLGRCGKAPSRTTCHEGTARYGSPFRHLEQHPPSCRQSSI